MKLVWMANSRPDLAVAIYQAPLFIEDRFNEGMKTITKRLNTSSKYAKDKKAHMKYPRLNHDSL